MRQSRNSNAGSYRSKRKTSVDARLEAQAELNDIEAEMLSQSRSNANKKIRKATAQR